MSGSKRELRNRIIILNDHLKIGGKETQIVNLLYSLEQHARPFRLFLLDGPNEYESRTSVKNIQIFSWRNNRIDTIRNLVLELIESKPAIIHFFSLRTGLVALLALPLLGFKVSLINGYIRNTHGPRSFSQHLKHQLLSFFSSTIISNSKAGLKTWGVKDLKKSSVIYNSFVPISGNARGFNNEASKNVAMIARYTYAKDFDLYFKAASIIRQTNPSITFHAYGAGEDMERLKSTYENEGSKVHGPSFFIDSIIRSCDLIVLCSKQEGIPNVLLESMYYRKPIVAIGRGGISELIVNGLNGIYMETSSPEELAMVITEELSINNSLRTENAYRTVINLFGINRMYTSYNNLYESILNS